MINATTYKHISENLVQKVLNSKSNSSRIKSIVLIIIWFFITSYLNIIAQNSWQQKSNYGGLAVLLPTGFAIGNKIYAGTGTNGTVQNDFWEYDTQTEIWTQKTSFPIARAGAAGFSIAGKGYISSGTDGVTGYQDLYEYNPSANTWTLKASYTGGKLISPVAFSIGDKAYLGTGSTGARNKVFWEYDPNNNTWTQKANYGGGDVYNATGFSIGSKGYIGTGNITGNIKTKQFYEYDPTTNIWTRKEDFAGTARENAMGFSVNTRGYIACGDDGALKKDLWEYNPATNKWVQKENFGGTARRQGLAIGNDANGFLGWGTDGARKNDFWVYTPSTIPSVGRIITGQLTNNSVLVASEITSDGKDTITQRGIVYSTNPNPTINDNISTTQGSLGSFRIRLTELSSLTNYYIRSFATNSFGTAYGDATEITTEPSDEDFCPNNGDGNADGIKDSDQDYVHSIFNPNTRNYITIISLDNYEIENPSIEVPNDSLYYYPGGLVKFTISQSQANIKIIYHNIQSLAGFQFRKQDSQGNYFVLPSTVFGIDTIAGKHTATVRFSLEDGGLGDHDGIVNGAITDPGGPAILALNANIPTLSEWARILLLVLLLSLGIWQVKKYA